jgi:hypothetical protein
VLQGGQTEARVSSTRQRRVWPGNPGGQESTEVSSRATRNPKGRVMRGIKTDGANRREATPSKNARTQTSRSHTLKDIRRGNSSLPRPNRTNYFFFPAFFAAFFFAGISRAPLSAYRVCHQVGGACPRTRVRITEQHASWSMSRLRGCSRASTRRIFGSMPYNANSFTRFAHSTPTR